jgi:hypothetical protein
MPEQLEAVPCPRCGEAPHLFHFHRGIDPLPFYRVECMCGYDIHAYPLLDPHQAIILWNQAAAKYVKEEQHE